MNWPLIAAGVMAGVGLVIAKQWFDRQGKGRERSASRQRSGIDAASAQRADQHAEEPPHASAAAAEVQAAPEPQSVTSDTPDTPVSEAGDAESVAKTDVETVEKQDTLVPPQPDTAASSESTPEPSPRGASDEKPVGEALASGDLSVMEAALREIDDPIQRNLLLDRLVAGQYRLRSEPEHREAFYRVAHIHTDEASAILSAVEAAGKPLPEQIEAFKSIAVALGEDGRYDEAVAICERALSLGLEDGTKTGFKGRIARLKKSRDSK